MSEPIPRVLGGHARQGGGNGFGQLWRSARFRARQGCFDFAPHHFDGIKVRRVSRPKLDLRSPLLDQIKGLFRFVRGEIVHDDHISSP